MRERKRETEKEIIMEREKAGEDATNKHEKRKQGRERESQQRKATDEHKQTGGQKTDTPPPRHPHDTHTRTHTRFGGEGGRREVGWEEGGGGGPYGDIEK